MSGVVFDPCAMITTAERILNRFSNEENFIEEHIYLVLRTLINHVFSNTTYVLADYTGSERQEIEEILIPLIRDTLSDSVSFNNARCRVDFISRHFAKIFEYSAAGNLTLAEQLLTTISQDIEEGNYNYPRHIVELINSNE